LRFALAGEVDPIATPQQPELFFRPVEGIALGAHGVFGVAHNAGDTPATARRAIASGAHVVEIDVVASRGRLAVAHDQPLPIAYGALRLRTVSLDRLWRIALDAPAIELDLKQSSPLFVEPLVAFLGAHRNADVIVAARHVSTLRQLRARTPWVRRFLSVGGRLSLERVLRDPTVRGVVQGVAVREDLLDAGTIRRLDARGLTILAWVVDDPDRTSALVRLGVDGITTNNLALLELLGRRRQSHALSRPAHTGGA
jgi:glycerophosphoryl diester phosphodiesterase